MWIVNNVTEELKAAREGKIPVLYRAEPKQCLIVVNIADMKVCSTLTNKEQSKAGVVDPAKYFHRLNLDLKK